MMMDLLAKCQTPAYVSKQYERTVFDGQEAKGRTEKVINGDPGDRKRTIVSLKLYAK